MLQNSCSEPVFGAAQGNAGTKNGSGYMRKFLLAPTGTLCREEERHRLGRTQFGEAPANLRWGEDEGGEFCIVEQNFSLDGFKTQQKLYPKAARPSYAGHGVHSAGVTPSTLATSKLD
jgi:hypothetical protein